MNFKDVLNQENLKKVDFNVFNGISLGKEFYEKQQHYRLLSYFSTLFNHVNIVEIGTHVGESAIALSYNENNTIYTFDILDHITPDKKRKNINYIIADVINNVENKKEWQDLILSSAFIFLDVDPHNGKMEYDFYLFLKDNNYQGFVICDDIWYFKEMRDHFWYKIDDQFKYDITHLGHWSGTGIFTFNPNIIFEKNELSNWTLVTAYFNLTKCSDASKEIRDRDKTYYFSHSLSTLSLPYYLIIFCDAESYDEIYHLRPSYLQDKTKYIVIEFDQIKTKNEITFSEHRDKIIQNRQKNPYYFDNRNTASYYLFCMSRYIFLKKIIQENPFHSTHFCWINFCIERMGYNNLKYLNESLSTNRDKFSTCYIDYIPEELVKNTAEYFQWGRCGMCSGFFTGNNEYMYKVCDLIEDKFLYYLSLGYGHADEQLYSPVYFENKDLFEHYYGDYQQMITNYKYIHECPEKPIQNFITNSLKYKNYQKCIEACQFLFHSIELNKCIILPDHLTTLQKIYENAMNNIDKTEIYLSHLKHIYKNDINEYESKKWQYETLKKREALHDVSIRYQSVLQIGKPLYHSLLIMIMTNPSLHITMITDMVDMEDISTINYLNTHFNHRILYLPGKSKDVLISLSKQSKRYDLVVVSEKSENMNEKNENYINYIERNGSLFVDTINTINIDTTKLTQINSYVFQKKEPTFVSAFLLNLNQRKDRSIQKYIEYGKAFIQTPVNKVIFIDEGLIESFQTYLSNPHTIYIPYKKEMMYLYSYSDQLDQFHLHTTTPEKDTIDYVFMNCHKTEFVRKAIEMNPFSSLSTQYIWVDFGLKSVYKNNNQFSTDLIQMSNCVYDQIRIASIWDMNTKYSFDIYSNVVWYFAGGVFGGHRDQLIKFGDRVKAKIIETIQSHRRIMWETNIWYMVYNESKTLFNPYYGTHDSTIVQNY